MGFVFFAGRVQGEGLGGAVWAVGCVPAGFVKGEGFGSLGKGLRLKAVCVCARAAAAPCAPLARPVKPPPCRRQERCCQENP